jgi:hypothetical protein
MLVFLLSLPSSGLCTCPTTLFTPNSDGRFDSISSCIVALGCIFESLSGAYGGGAIRIAAAAATVTVNESSFLSCSAPNPAISPMADHAGGACWLDCATAIVARCCALACSAGTQGNFVFCTGAGVRWFEVTGVAQCARRSDFGSSRGGFHFCTLLTANLSSVNMTASAAEISPCVSATTAHSAGATSATVRLSCRFCSFVGNVGMRGFNRPNATGADGWYLVNCNFCANEFQGAVLFTVKYGMHVDGCLFMGNTGGVDIGTDGNATLAEEDRFVIRNCVFSGGLPSAAFASLSQCAAETATELWTISERLCPT